MVYISEMFVKHIKEAKDSKEISTLLDRCFREFRAKSGDIRIDKKYTRNVLMSLKYYRAKEIKPKALENINTAIELVKKIHADGIENIL